MNPTQLDLSKFPKINPNLPEGEEAREIDKRSAAIRGIKDQAENLVKAMSAYVFDLQSFDQKIKIMAQRESVLKQSEYDLAQREKKLFEMEEDIKQQKEYITRTNLSLKEREAKILTDKDYAEQIRIEKDEYEQRRVEALRQEKLLDEKVEVLDALNKRGKELDEREALIEKEKAIDAERKRLLDVREERIKAKETRLRLDQDE